MPRRYRRRRRRMRRTRTGIHPGQNFTMRTRGPSVRVVQPGMGRIVRHGGFTNYIPNIRNLQVGGLPGNFPKTTRMRLKYCSEFSLNAMATGWAGKVFRTNSLYDPEYAVGGHSAYMFDEMMQFYGKYRVVSSKIKVWYINPAVVDQVPFYLTVLRSKDPNVSTQFASTDHILESNLHGAVKVCGSFTIANNLAQAQASTCNMTYSQRKYFPGILDKDFEAQVGENPVTQAYFHVVQFSLAGNDPPIAYFRCEISFNVIFSELIILPESGVTDEGIEATTGGTGPIGSLALSGYGNEAGGYTGDGGP